MSKPLNMYRVLGITPSANHEQLRKAYLEKASRTHPDVCGGTQKAFTDIIDAYDVLSDSREKRKHDAALRGDPDNRGVRGSWAGAL
jgi:curved DNA-binding protein CbpA